MIQPASRILPSRDGTRWSAKAMEGSATAIHTQWWDQDTGLMSSISTAVADTATKFSSASTAHLMTSAATATRARERTSHTALVRPESGRPRCSSRPLTERLST